MKALVTGGNSGIGYSTAEKFKAQGYEVCILGREKKQTEAAAHKLGVDWVCMDLSESKESNFSSLEEMYPDGLDVLVNNAGIAKPAPIQLCTNDLFLEHLQVNLLSPYFLIKSLVSSLSKSKGCVVNVSSVITKRSMPGMAHYAASKAALESITRSLAVELAGQSIRLNAVCPGAIETPLLGKFGLPESELDKMKAHAMTTTPIGRFGKAAEVAEVIFCAAISSYVTGAVWTVDGGVSA